MILHRLRSFDEYRRHAARDAANFAAHVAALEQMTPKDDFEPFKLRGYSYTARSFVDFDVAFTTAATPYVNWRETVNCPVTAFNNRMRSTIHLVDIEAELYPTSRIYLTEQVTPMYRHFHAAYPQTTGSEFLGDAAVRGQPNANGIRHEDMTQLSFEDESFDAVISLDVLEHIPDFQKAFREAARVLAPGGKLIWSAPFVDELAVNHIRARVENGEIVHLVPPEYHGDPVTNEGVLCYQHFGWEVLDQMRAAGFRDVYAITFYSLDLGYISPQRQYLFFAVK